MSSSGEPTHEPSFMLRLGVGLSKLFHRGFEAKLRMFCTGRVLDVGGANYYLRARRDLEFDDWTCLESDADHLLSVDDPRYQCVLGDGCDMEFRDDTFDTVINAQVLEHVFDPLAMVKEIARVMKPGGHGLFVIPQTGDLHMAPAHFQNFTRYWIIEAMRRANLEIIELTPLGGVWRTLASRSTLFFWHAFRVEGSYVPGVKRPLAFYLMFPFMAGYAVMNTVICLLFSIGDLVEEANNHLVVVRKPG